MNQQTLATTKILTTKTLQMAYYVNNHLPMSLGDENSNCNKPRVILSSLTEEKYKCDL